MRSIITRAVLPLAVACAVLGGCSSLGQGSASSADAPAAGNGRVVAQDGSQSVEKSGGSVPQSPVLDTQQITRSATMTLIVKDTVSAATRLRTIASVHGGLVTTENVLSGDKQYEASTLVLSVPADELDNTLSDIAGVGDVTLRTIQSTDVTTQVADVESRITTMRDSIARLQELLSRAGSITEIAQVENELTSRQADLESLLAQQKALAKRVAQSPITVTLTTDRTPVPVPVETGFLAGLKAGWHALTTVGVGLLTVLGAVLPFLAVLAVIAVPVALLLRRRVAHRPTATTASPSTGAED